MRLGLVADTHGFFDPSLSAVFAGCGLVLHAGDVTRAEVLDEFRRIAPVRAVRGNNDEGPFGESLPEAERVAVEGIRILLVHEARPDEPSPALERLIDREPVDLVVHGHSHRPGTARVGPLLFVNPGSAGPRRFSLPRSACVLDVAGRRVTARWWDLSCAPAAPLGAPFEADL